MLISRNGQYGKSMKVAAPDLGILERKQRPRMQPPPSPGTLQRALAPGTLVLADRCAGLHGSLDHCHTL